MSENQHEDPLESLLDPESDSDFGLPVFRDHLGKDNAPLVLRNWSAKDFSDIYVRFQPHLIRHAKRYLSSHSQAEEVVQDAFLYLMTSLPEIDSEVGALKLLKWKVRLLALDVISSNSKAAFASINEDFELEAEGEEVDQNLLRADEAAIVSLALAKLQPRQREVLIASIYEEKPTAVVASQLGLNENATRQLLLRSKNAFKRALIGEAETAGLSVPQILSIAARKASQDAGKYIAAASALLLALAISVGVIPNLGLKSPENIAKSAYTHEERLDALSLPNLKPQIELSDMTPANSVDSSSTEPAEIMSVESSNASYSSTILPNKQQHKAASKTNSDNASSSTLSAALLFGYLGGTTNAGFGYASGNSQEQAIRELLIFDGETIESRVDLVRIGESLEYRLDDPHLRLVGGEEIIEVEVGSFASTFSNSNDETALTLVGNGLTVLDENGKVYSEQPLKEKSLTIMVQLDRYSQVFSASVFVQ